MPSSLPDIDRRISMDLLRATSPSVSTSSSLDSNGLPHCRINCNKSRILVGNQKFESATDALVAYLNQFDLNEGPSPVVSLPKSESDWKSKNGHLGGDVNGQKCDEVQVTDKGFIGSGLVMGPNGLCLEDNKEDVEKLLTSKVSPELKEEVTDTLREVKLRHLLKKAAIKSQKQTKTGLQQEVEAALARSAKLLEKVTREDLASTKAAFSDLSDVSISTQALLAGNSGSSDDSMLSVESLDMKEKNPGHVYSYRQSPSKTAQLPVSPSLHNCQRHSRHRTRRGSIDSLLPPQDLVTSQVKVSSNGSSNSLSNNSDPSDIIKRIRSRSVPPRLHKQQGQSRGQDWLSELDRSVSKSVPSWVKSMSPSEISDSVWVQKSSTQKSTIPSWVEDVNKSEISIDVSALDSLPGDSMLSSPSRPNLAPRLSSHHQRDVDVECIATESRPKHSHTVTSPTLSPSLTSAKHVTFGDNEMLTGSLNPLHSTPISKNLQRTGGKYPIRTLTTSKVLDSEFNGEAYLRNNILPQTARLKKSMENFAISTENLRKSSSSSSSDASSDHKCSSLDTFALLTGKTMLKGDGQKQKSMGNAMFPDSLAISSILPEGSQGRLSNGQSSSDGLDGDRPWEAMTNTFKPPVPVGGADDVHGLNGPGVDAALHKHLSTSLSGGNQPGSMEALKNMLFKLQAEEKCVQETNSNSNTENTNESQPPSSPAVIPALQDYDFQLEPGGHSLEKALLHLNRLKTLVKNTATSSKSNTDTAAMERGSQEKEPLGSERNGTAS